MRSSGSRRPDAYLTCSPDFDTLWDEFDSPADQPVKDAPRRGRSCKRPTSAGILRPACDSQRQLSLADLLAVMRFREFEPGGYLIRQGDPAEFLLLILNGNAFAQVRNAPANRPPVGTFDLAISSAKSAW